eukprot:15687397-Heterocapsa_arctica.AAC.1
MEGLLDDDLWDASECAEEPWTLNNVDDFRQLLIREAAKVAHVTHSIAHEHALKAARANLDM